MIGIMGDNDITGQFRYLLSLLESPTWGELWVGLQLSVMDFKKLELPPTASDRVGWQTCQEREVILVTGNRNDDGPDSLEATIRTLNHPGCLPVFTIGDVNRFGNSREYAEEVAESLLDYLLELDNCRGTGRLYLP